MLRKGQSVTREQRSKVRPYRHDPRPLSKTIAGLVDVRHAGKVGDRGCLPDVLSKKASREPGRCRFGMPVNYTATKVEELNKSTWR